MIVILPIVIFSWLALYVCALEPPFPPAVVSELNRLANLPSLVSTDQLLAGLSPAQLEAYLASASVETTNNSLPNPIASTFPNLTTGTINGSFVVLPLDYSVARAIVPSQFGILKQSLKAVLPFFPEDKYPLVLSNRIDHDVRSLGAVKVPDFSSAQFRFPFIDLLGDGYSTYSYIPTLFVSNNILAEAGSRLYGEFPILSTFDPPHDPYAPVPGDRNGSIYFDIFRANTSGPAVFNSTFRPQPGRFGEIGDYPLSFYTNITNQPTFGCADSSCILSCDSMNRIYNTNLTAGPLAPVGISGSVSLAPAAKSGVSFFPHGARFQNVKGVKLDVAFIENNYKNCSDLKGYRYLGI